MQQCIVTYIDGGLGNQMFQYAAGRALALRLGVPLRLDVSRFFRKRAAAPRPLLLPVFSRLAVKPGDMKREMPPLPHRILRKCSEIAQWLFGLERQVFPHIVTEPHFGYWPGITRVSAPVRLYGYWQSEKYFALFPRQIREEFTFPPLPQGGVLELAARIRSCPNAVSLHIRRGDYVNNPHTHAFHGMPGKEYYAAALDRIRAAAGTTTVFLFSDEPQWVREHFDCRGHAPVVVDLGLPDAPQHDMHLMSLCRHHIIANSSFSWWGAWLGGGQGITVAPRRWFAASVKAVDICPPSWLLL